MIEAICTIGALVILTAFFSLGYASAKKMHQSTDDVLPKCNCDDSTQCDVWCQAKQNLKHFI